MDKNQKIGICLGALVNELLPHFTTVVLREIDKDVIRIGCFFDENLFVAEELSRRQLGNSLHTGKLAGEIKHRVLAAKEKVLDEMEKSQ